jgi:type VI secretion system Hcp family effector
MTLKTFPDSIDILSFSQRVDVPSGGAAQVSPIEIRRHTDPMSPLLAVAAAKRQVIVSGNLVLLGGARTDYRTFTISLTNVVINEITSDTLSDGTPIEKLSLSFDKITWEYDFQDPVRGGFQSVIATYDVVNRTGTGGAMEPRFVNLAPNASNHDYLDEVPFSSLALQLTNSGSGSTVISPLTLVTIVSQATVSQLGAAVTGAVMDKVTAHYVWSLGGLGGMTYDHLRYDLATAQVTSVAIDTASAGTLQETLGFNYQKITWTGQSVTEENQLGPEYTGEWPEPQTAH